MDPLEAGAPSKPHLTDEYRPTNPGLWETVLAVAKGQRSELKIGDRTIHAPNDGDGFFPWPHPNGIAWAVKQYNGFNGGWNRKASTIFDTMRARGLVATQPGSFDHDLLEHFKAHGLVRQAHATNSWHYWETTPQGRRHVFAAAKESLRSRMGQLLHALQDGSAHQEEAKALGPWVQDTFQVSATHAELHDLTNRFAWSLQRPTNPTELNNLWANYCDRLNNITKLATDAGFEAPR